VSRDTLGVGRSHLGWMNFQDNKVFQDIEENPINFKYILDVFSLEEYHKKVKSSGENLDGPRVIVTSSASFEYGFTRKILREFISKPKNEILFL
jgi:Cft2 family RNA processing exonuclease